MVRSLNRVSCALPAFLTAVVLVGTASAQMTAYDLLPETTQAAVWVPDSKQIIERWEKTQLWQLTHDEKIAPFFREKRREIEKRLMDAGWRLNIQPEDLADFATGQLALAWASKPETPVKPYALALLADVADDKDLNSKMLQKFEQQLDPAKALKRKLFHEGVEITRYELPPRAGEFIKQESYLAIIDGLLIASDDEALIKSSIDRVKGKLQGGSLAEEANFIKGRQLAQVTGQGQVEYFVRPLGFARVIRAIAGARSKSSTDILAALDNQGFSAIECVCGELIIGGDLLDVEHHGYVYAVKPLEKSAKVLDFPNKASQIIPNFIGDNISSMLVTHWNAQEAFWATQGLVDELAGTPGVFDEVIEGIRMDVNGPQIDIRQVLPNFTNDIYSVSDSKRGDADINSRRNMIALKVNDHQQMADVLDRAMRGEPDAEPIDFSGHVIWKVVHRELDDIAIESDFGDFGGPPAAAQSAEEPWLSNWAITVHNNYLIFASHLEMIQEAIQQSQASEHSPLMNSEDYQRVRAAISQFFGDDEASAWRILRSEKAYRVQYELFRKGELHRSESMLASILDRLVQSNDEIADKNQKISGEGLPEFSEIAKYFQPGGFIVRSTDNGWKLDSLMLGKSFSGGSAEDPTVTQASQYGTARVSNSNHEANR